MSLLAQIHDQIRQYHLLNHPFYKDWMAGRLTKKQLQSYALQYIPFVEAFPRFVSATHSLCISSDARKVLLENLLDEEGFRHSAPHPILWRNFVEGLNASTTSELSESKVSKNLESIFFSLCKSSYEEGLCALYAYEYQIPEIAKAKIEGLAQHYGISDARTTEFFTVHQEADVYHSKACAELINSIETEKSEVSISAAKDASQALWNFLTEIHVQ